MKIVNLSSLRGLAMLFFVTSAYAGDPPTSVAALPELPPLGGVVSLPGTKAVSQSFSRSESSSTVYKYIMPDGRIAYSDRPIPGAKLEKKLSETSRSSGVSLIKPLASSEVSSVHAERKPAHDVAAKKNAEAALTRALQEQKVAAEIGESDRLITANRDMRGKRYSRFTESYLDRQAEADGAVAKAKDALEKLGDE